MVTTVRYESLYALSVCHLKVELGGPSVFKNAAAGSLQYTQSCCAPEPSARGGPARPACRAPPRVRCAASPNRPDHRPSRPPATIAPHRHNQTARAHPLQKARAGVVDDLGGDGSGRLRLDRVGRIDDRAVDILAELGAVVLEHLDDITRTDRTVDATLSFPDTRPLVFAWVMLLIGHCAARAAQPAPRHVHSQTYTAHTLTDSDCHERHETSPECRIPRHAKRQIVSHIDTMPRIPPNAVSFSSARRLSMPQAPLAPTSPCLLPGCTRVDQA